RPLEAAMREAIAAKLSRGKVDCRVTYTRAQAGARTLVPDEQAMAALQAAGQRVSARFADARPLSVAEVLHWPGVLADDALSPDNVKDDLFGVLNLAIADLDASRAREGAKLEAVLRERLDSMARLVEEARPLVPAALK